MCICFRVFPRLALHLFPSYTLCPVSHLPCLTISHIHPSALVVVMCVSKRKGGDLVCLGSLLVFCFSFPFVQIQHLPIFYLSSFLSPSSAGRTIQNNTDHSVPSSHNSNPVVIQHNQICLLPKYCTYGSYVPPDLYPLLLVTCSTFFCDPLCNKYGGIRCTVYGKLDV